MGYHKTLAAVLFLVAILYVLSIRPIPRDITYGVSFSKFHADELQLDWKETYLAILDDLGVRHFRFSAHWPNTEPAPGQYNFLELDYQIEEAEKRGADFILAVGRRLPGWPECHEPSWIQDQKSKFKNQNDPFGKTQDHPEQSRTDDRLKFQNDQVIKYITTVVQRYKERPGLVYWQVENEPFLTFFSRSHCGVLDKHFLSEEITLVKKLDPSHPILVTDSGEFGNWFQAYRRGDVFGTSLYLYIWNKKIGPWRYPITPAFFRIKRSLVELILGPKPSMIIELSAEPWLVQPIVSAPLPVLLDRMGVDKFNEMINFSNQTGFDRQYLWGAEWWYWLKKNGYSGAHWKRAKLLF